MSDSNYRTWMIEIKPDVSPIGPIADYDEAVGVFESFIGITGKHPVKFHQFTCDAALPKRFPLSTYSSIQGAVLGGYGVIETLRELDLKGCEVRQETAVSPSP